VSELTALEKHSCAACGAQAAWNPARQALICAFCGTVAPGRTDPATGTIEELDLARALRDTPDADRGWLEARRSVRCRSCSAVSVFEAARVGQHCEFCGSTELVDYDEIRAPIRPASLLPFTVDRSAVATRIRRWLGGRWLAPGTLKRQATIDQVHGIYVPYWTFDARVHCPWTAESGTYFSTTESYRDSSGRTRTRQVRHVRWRPASGAIDHVFDDEPVPGTKGIDIGLLQAVEPFPTASLVPYDTRYLAGFVVEHYQVVLLEAAERARQAMHRTLQRLCAAEVPGDTQRNLQIAPAFSNETFKHVLLPVWLLAYRFRGRAYQVVVNGVTGAVAGRYPKSAWKIALIVLAAVLAIVIWALATS
jgi:hypothetical protein